MTGLPENDENNTKLGGGFETKNRARSRLPVNSSVEFHVEFLLHFEIGSHEMARKMPCPPHIFILRYSPSYTPKYAIKDRRCLSLVSLFLDLFDDDDTKLQYIGK